MRHDPTAIMIFCAGFGSRMGDLTQNTPKPMLEVGGRALVDHALDQLPQNLPAVANLHYLPGALETHLGARGIKTIFEAKILETGGGLKNALPDLDADVVITSNTDAVWLGPKAGEELLKAWQPDKMDALLLVIPRENTHAHLGKGDFSLSSSDQASRGGQYVYSGIQIIKTESVKAIGDTYFSLNVIWDSLLENGRLFATPYSGQWVDVGHPQGLKEAESLLGKTNV